MRFLTFEALDSTNAEAARRVKDGAELPLWIMAKTQSSGRGRRGREWVSQQGNLFCTAVYQVSEDAQHDAQKSFVAALAIYDTLTDYVSSSLLSIKWPNDVLLDGKKVSGILLERLPGGLCVGIGVNLLSKPDSVTDQETACVIDYIDESLINDPEPILEMPEPVFAILASKFTQWTQRHDEDGFSPIRDAWLSRAAGMGAKVRVNLAKDSFTGYAEGLSEDGALMIKMENGDARLIHAGDIFFEGG